jgi:hypothetical protein
MLLWSARLRISAAGPHQLDANEDRLPDSTGDWPGEKGKRKYQKNAGWQLVFGGIYFMGWISIFAHYLAERVSRAAEQRHIVAHGGAVGQRSQTHSSPGRGDRNRFGYFFFRCYAALKAGKPVFPRLRRGLLSFAAPRLN